LAHVNRMASDWKIPRNHFERSRPIFPAAFVHARSLCPGRFAESKRSRPTSSGRPYHPPSFRTERADFFFRVRSCECVGSRREKSLFSCTPHLTTRSPTVTIHRYCPPFGRLVHVLHILWLLPPRGWHPTCSPGLVGRAARARIHAHVQRHQ